MTLSLCSLSSLSLPTSLPPLSFSLAVIHAYEDSLRLSKKKEEELMEKLNDAQRDSQKKNQKCSKLEDDMYYMQKKMVASRDDYEQQEKSMSIGLNNF